MRLIDADRLLEEKRIHLYYHLPNGDVAIPLIDIKNAPSEDRPIGKWIDMSNGRAIRTPWWESGKCDQCGKYGSKAWDYCPHCGSRNGGEQSEVD